MSRSFRAFAGSVVPAFIAILGIAREASASPSARLLYVRNVGTEGCPDESELRKSVAVRLGYDPFFPWATTTVLATIDRAGTGYRAEITILDEHSAVLGRRALVTRGEDCSELTTTVGLAVSVALDDLDLGASVAPTPAATSGPRASPLPLEQTRAPVQALALPPAPRRSLRRPVVLAVSAGPVASIGVAPRPSVGGAVSVQIRWAWLSLQVDGHADVPASGIYRGVLVATYVAGGSPALCAHASWGGYTCGVLFLGRLSAQGTRTDDAFYSAAGARIGIDLALGGPLFVDVHADGLGKLTDDAVAVDGTPVFTPFPFSASVAGWVGAHF